MRARLRRHLTTVLPHVAQIIGQTTRRVMHGEVTPAADKLVWLFETQADVLVKERRVTSYGHKVYLTTRRSGLIPDCAIPQGNPGDVTWAVPLVQRHERLFGSAPRQVSTDGAFAPKDNLEDLKAHEVADVCFAKKRGLAVLDMVRSQWVHDKLRRFRAGIESSVSLLKRVFGRARCVLERAGLFSPLRADGHSRGQSPAPRARVFPDAATPARVVCDHPQVGDPRCPRDAHRSRHRRPRAKYFRGRASPRHFSLASDG